jgi:hypothetical protein
MSRRKADNFLNFGIKYLNALQNRGRNVNFDLAGKPPRAIVDVCMIKPVFAHHDGEVCVSNFDLSVGLHRRKIFINLGRGGACSSREK